MLSVVDIERRNSPLKQTSEEFTLIQAAAHRAEVLRRNPQAFTCEERQIVRRGEWALQQLLYAHRSLILRLVTAYRSKGYNDNCDLEQEATLAFFDAVVSYDPAKGAQLSTWAYFQIRACLQKLTGANIHQAVAAAKLMQSEPAISDPEPIQEQGFLERLRSIIHELTLKQQQVVSLHLEGWSWSEIALKLQSTADAVRMRWNRAVQRLRLLLVPGLIAAECEEAEVIEPQPVEDKQSFGEPLLRRLFQPISLGLLCFRSLRASTVKTHLWQFCTATSCDAQDLHPLRGQNLIGDSQRSRLGHRYLSKLKCSATWCLSSGLTASDGVRGSPIDVPSRLSKAILLCEAASF